MIVSDPFVVFHDPELYATFPSVSALEDGSLIVAFRAAHDDRFLQSGEPAAARQRHLHPRSQILLQRLLATGERSGGATLFPPDLAAADQDPTLTALPDGRLLLSAFSWKPISEAAAVRFRDGGTVVGHEPASESGGLLWGVFTSISPDGGRTWSDRRYLPPLPDFSDAVPGRRARLGGCARGQLCRASDGALLLPTYDRRTVQNLAFESHVYASQDGGANWTHRAVIARDPSGTLGFCETALLACDDGTILAFHRTVGAEERLAVSRSTDDGQTWSAPEMTEVVGLPFAALRTGGDRPYWLFYGRRRKEISIRACPLDGNGVPDLTAERVIRAGAEVRDIGYPSATRLADGRGALTYYWADEDGVRHIAGHILEF